MVDKYVKRFKADIVLMFSNTPLHRTFLRLYQQRLLPTARCASIAAVIQALRLSAFLAVSPQDQRGEQPHETQPPALSP